MKLKYLIFNPVIHESAIRFRLGTMCLQGTPFGGFYPLYDVILGILIILFFLYAICNGQVIEGGLDDKLVLPLPKRRHQIYKFRRGNNTPICLMCWIQGAQITRVIFVYWSARDAIFCIFRFIIQYPAVKFMVTDSRNYCNSELATTCISFRNTRRLVPLPALQRQFFELKLLSVQLRK